MSKVFSLRLADRDAAELRRTARRLGRTPSQTGAALIEEGLRQMQFTGIEFRDTLAGRQPYVKGSRLAVWQAAILLQEYQGDVKKVAEHTGLPVARIQAAANYFEAFRDEVQAAIDENRQVTFEELKRLLPQIERVTIGKKTFRRG